jgi:hypothetical protein
VNRASIVRLDQGIESPLRAIRSSAFKCRYAYARSADSRHDNQPGQDYLVFCDLGHAFVFAACDGVGQSFYGNLAARLLGDELVAWLAEYAPAPGDTVTPAADLSNFLSTLTATATAQVNEQPVPAEPPLLRDVLLEKQARGSEAMFVCGRIDLEGPEASGGRVLLAWMGDMRVHLWRDNKRVDLGGRHETEERWSSRHGPIGEGVHVYSSPLTAGDSGWRLIVYSDGLKLLDEIVNQRQSNDSLSRIIETANASPESDDVTYLELFFNPLRPAATDEPLKAAQPPPAVQSFSEAAGPPAVLPPPPTPAQPATAPRAAPGIAPAPPPARRKSSWTLALLGGALLIGLCAIVWLATDFPMGALLSSLRGVGEPTTMAPTLAPTADANPILLPLDTPTPTPTETLTMTPALTPTSAPTETPTMTPTLTPASTPTETPTGGTLALQVIIAGR